MIEDRPEMDLPEGNSLERTERLIWMYLDDTLPEQHFPELEDLLHNNKDAVQLYVDCVQLHADLIGHFQEPRKIKLPTASDTPVLGSLGDGFPSVDAGPPVTEN